MPMPLILPATIRAGRRQGVQEITGRNGGLPHTGEGWYRQWLDVPAAAQKRCYRLECDGIMSHAKVYCNGTYAGVCNGDATSLESFNGSRIKAFNGLCVLYIQSRKGEGGGVTIAACADGLTQGAARLQSVS